VCVCMKERKRERVCERGRGVRNKSARLRVIIASCQTGIIYRMFIRMEMISKDFRLKKQQERRDTLFFSVRIQCLLRGSPWLISD